VRPDIIETFLKTNTHSDLAGLYNRGMQCHVVVSADGGTRSDNLTWTNGIESWYPFVISDEQSASKDIHYNFDKHVEGIGLTGWDWINKHTIWVAFDFDSIIGHKHGLTNVVLDEIMNTLMSIPWVTVRKSTSGRGFHVYVRLCDPIETANRTEHAAVARAILHKMSALTGYNFKDKVDICGGNMWIWHRKMTEVNQGLVTIKQGDALDEIPDWQSQIDCVITGRPANTPMDALISSKAHVGLDLEHRKLITWLQEHGTRWSWDADKNMLVAHTYDLLQAHLEIPLKGIFQTKATGKNNPDINCFLFPLRHGAWVVRRFGKGTSEEQTWELDQSGWTRCYYNVDVDLATASRLYNGVEHPTGAYIFASAEHAIRALSLLGINPDLPSASHYCRTSIKEHKDGRLIIMIEDKESKLSPMIGWIREKSQWKRIYSKNKTNHVNEELYQYDELVRHLISQSGNDMGWSINIGDSWHAESLIHVRLALESFKLSQDDVKNILGNSVLKCWRIVNVPFAPEYPGDRRWNRSSAQLAFSPSMEVPVSFYEACPTWFKMMAHLGESLNDVLKTNEWAIQNHIYTGLDYLICWVSSLFQAPLEPLPYLFLWGPQCSGKTMFHEALATLITNGYMRADTAVVNKSGFNAELESAVLCIIEEINLKKSNEAANRIKDWVTARSILIHRKNQTPYIAANVSHWIQASNEFDACPVFFGDTRVTVMHVDALMPTELISRKLMIDKLKEEAPNFLAYVLSYQIPQSNDRLNVPVILTSDKQAIQNANKSSLESFISENCFPVEGALTKLSDFYNHFVEWMGPTLEHWSKIRVSRELPPNFPKGRLPKDGHFYIGNISLEKEVEKASKWMLAGEFLIQNKGE